MAVRPRCLKTVDGVARTKTSIEIEQRAGQPARLDYYRARFYNSQTGRFISEDPIGFGGGDVYLYRYVTNNPLSFADPLGLLNKSTIWSPTGVGIGLEVIGGIGLVVESPVIATVGFEKSEDLRT